MATLIVPPGQRGSQTRDFQSTRDYDHVARMTTRHRSGEPAGVIVSGLVTLPIWQRMLRDNAAFVAQERVSGQVADYSQAVLALEPQSMLDSARLVAIADPQIRLPTAIVAPPEAFEMCRSYCRLMSECGFWRRAFLDADEALRWAVEYAVLREELLAQRSTPRPAIHPEQRRQGRRGAR